MDTKESIVFRKKLAALIQVAGDSSIVIEINKSGWVKIASQEIRVEVDLEKIKTLGMLKPDCISTLPSLKAAKEIYNIKNAFNADCIFELDAYEIKSVKRAYN